MNIPPNIDGAEEYMAIIDEPMRPTEAEPPGPAQIKRITADRSELLNQMLGYINSRYVAPKQVTYRVRFWGRRLPQGGCQEVLPPQANVSSYEMHETGEWFITVEADSGQEVYTRLSNLVATISVDEESEPALGEHSGSTILDEVARGGGA